MFGFIYATFLLLTPHSSLAVDRPLKAIPLKEGNRCAVACLTIFDHNSDDLQTCILSCQEETRTRGGFPLENKVSKRPQNPSGPSSKM